MKRSSEDAEEARKERIRVQNALEQKAIYYDRLKSGKYQDKDGLFLVNFDGKEEDSDSDEPIPEPKDDGEEWVEYVDALGRSRTCMRSELQEMRKRDLKGSSIMKVFNFS